MIDILEDKNPIEERFYGNDEESSFSRRRRSKRSRKKLIRFSTRISPEHRKRRRKNWKKGLKIAAITAGAAGLVAAGIFAGPAIAGAVGPLLKSGGLVGKLVKTGKGLVKVAGSVKKMIPVKNEETGEIEEQEVDVPIDESGEEVQDIQELAEEEIPGEEAPAEETESFLGLNIVKPKGSDPKSIKQAKLINTIITIVLVVAVIALGWVIYQKKFAKK